MPVTISGTTGVQTPGVTNSGTSTAALFSGPLAGNVTGNASTATLATNATVAASASNIVPASNLGLATCKAWVNFDGSIITSGSNMQTGQNISVTAGSNIGTFQNNATWPSNYIGVIFFIPSIGGVTGATLGGVNVSTVGIQIVSAVGSTATVRLLAGNATSSQTVNGNGTSSGWTYATSGIRSSYNVSSVVKTPGGLATGDYTINFTTPMADAFYCVTGTGGGGGSGETSGRIQINNNVSTPLTTTSARILYVGAAYYDPIYASVAIFGN